MAGIAILIPVLNRPQNAMRVVESIVAATSVQHEIMFLCTRGDYAEIEACEALFPGVLTVFMDGPPGNGDYAAKINKGFRWTTTPFVFTGADDLDFQPGWDTAALAALESSGAGVCGTWDGGNPLVKKGRHSTHSLVRRAYIDECGGTWHDGPGVVLHEGYRHQWVDTELCEVAMERDCWVFAYDSRVIHKHPFWDRSVPRDATYEKALSGASEDLALFRARKAAAR